MARVDPFAHNAAPARRAGHRASAARGRIGTSVASAASVPHAACDPTSNITEEIFPMPRTFAAARGVLAAALIACTALPAQAQNIEKLKQMKVTGTDASIPMV